MSGISNAIERAERALRSGDFAWNSPKTYVVLVPGISLLLGIDFIAGHIPDLVQAVDCNNNLLKDRVSKRILPICKWQFRGAVVQGAAAALALKVGLLPAVAGLTLICAAAQALYAIHNTLRHGVAVYEVPAGCESNLGYFVRSAGIKNLL